MQRFLKIVMALVLLLIAGDTVSYAQTAKSIQRRQEATRKEISETNKKIKSNTARTKRSLNQLNLIESEISSHEKNINDLTRELETISRKLKLLNDSIKNSEKEIEKLKDNYSRAIRSINARSSSFDRMLFVFSASSFNQAFRRMRYLKQFSEWREKQTVVIQKMQERLKTQHITVDAYYKQRASSLAKQNNERLVLVKKRKQQSDVVASLKNEGQELKRVLAEKQRQARKLDEELNRLIAEEERKAALRAKQEEERRLAEQKKKQSEKKTSDSGKPSQSGSGSKTTVAEGSNAENAGKGSKEIAAAVKHSSGYSMSDVERKLSGSFESNKGRLLFPVSGQYRIVRLFGRQQHPELKYVQTDNGGIDIESPAGTKARAVFDGKVSAVFRQDGFNTVVMVRHGNYLTIYVNLSEIYVSNGESVKAGQSIGKVFSDPEDDNRTILHFEVRKEREKLNPQLWVK